MLINKKEKILITTSSFAELDKSPMEKLISSQYEIINNPYRRKVTKYELLELLTQEVVGLIAGLEILDREIMEKSKLKTIARVGSGMSNVDVQSAKELGIKVSSTPDGPTTAVAELTVGALLSMVRMIPQMDGDLHQGKWNKKIGYQLDGKTVLIIGFGRIGRKVASLLNPFNVKIIIVDPFYTGDLRDYHKMSLHEALPKADLISIHSSGEESLLDTPEFSIMKKGVYILNAARGSLISESALISALDCKTVAGAWLDTFEKEPYKGALTNYEQVILTPHVGSYTYECRKKMEMDAVNNLLNDLRR